MNVEADLSKGRLTIEHFAYDDVTLTDTDDCETKPSSALPEPKSVCTFEDGACGWTQEPPEGDEHYHFRRVNGAQVDAEHLAGPEHDYENNAEGFFMNADANGTTSHGDVALVYSSYFNGSVYPRECLHFYYSLEVSRRQSQHDGSRLSVCNPSERSELRYRVQGVGFGVGCSLSPPRELHWEEFKA